MRLKLLLFLCLVCCSGALADSRVEAIFEKVKKVNPKLVDYSADIDIDLVVRVGFIPYRPDANGKYYYKKPDQHKLELKKAPGYLKDYPSIFGWSLPSLEKYKSVVQQETEWRGQPVYYVVLLPKGSQGDIQRIEMWINRKDHTVPRQITYYSGNGKLEVQGSYARHDGFLVFDKMQANFDFPKASVKAQAVADYTNYRFNLGLTDDFFKKEP